MSNLNTEELGQGEMEGGGEVTGGRDHKQGGVKQIVREGLQKLKDVSLPCLVPGENFNPSIKFIHKVSNSSS